MITTAKELRFNINMLFDVLGKGEDITITYRGKPKAKLVPLNDTTQEMDSTMFGMWKDRDLDVDTHIRELRKGRTFAV